MTVLITGLYMDNTVWKINLLVLILVYEAHRSENTMTIILFDGQHYIKLKTYRRGVSQIKF